MKLKWKILVAIVVLYLLGIIGIIWQTYSATKPDIASPITEAIKVGLIMFGGLGVILPTYLNIWQSLETSNLIEDNIRRSKIENTFSLLEKWDDKSLFDARKFTRELKDQHNQLSPDQIRDRIKNTPELRQSVILLFNYFDLIRISIENDRIDVAVLKQCLAPTCIDICNRFKPWVEEQADKSDVEKFIKLIS